MADITTSSWCARKWYPSGSSQEHQYRANLSTTLNTTATACTISYTHRLELDNSVGHNGYNWSCGGKGSGSGTVNSTNGGSKLITCKSGTTSSVSRGHSATTISVSGTIWATSSGGTNPWNGEKVTATKTYTVPAKQSWTITYNANGGTGSDSAKKWYNENLTLSNGSGFLRPHYTQTGWNTAADGTGTHYNLGATYTANAGATLYAEWKLNSVKSSGKVSGAWKNGILYAKISGVWKIPHTAYAKVNGIWKQIKE